MNDKDLILKYLGGLLEGEELESFERKLENSPEFSAEYEKISSGLKSLKATADVKYDNRYFASSLAKMKTRSADSPKRRRLIPALSAVSFAAVILFFFLSAPLEENILINENLFTDELYSALLSVENDELNDFIKRDMVSHYSYYGDLETELELEPGDGEAGNNSVNEYGVPYNYNYDVLNDASTEEIDQLYNTLLETKIL
ncbi:MAG: hypothetical protein SCALA702_09530 [Melioribacteraceae bacterium]|nr:MAG: hypothetical protein SCALA702_09530 [Melioribacteraceae bacterium]